MQKRRFKNLNCVNKDLRRRKNMKGLWENKEVTELFKTVENSKQKGISLRNAFASHAKKYGRQPNSVRNYYYQEIDRLANDKARSGELKIDLKKHIKNKSASFSKEEEKNLVAKIDQLRAQGKSVRGACFVLSEGDPTKMLRYQNKYRNAVKQKESKSGGADIIKFSSKRQGLSESDITSLFMGLVRLVKRNITSEIEQKQQKDKESLNEKLRKATLMLGEKDHEILTLKEKFDKLRQDYQALNQKMMKLKCEKASLLSKKLSSSKVKAVINV